MLNKIYCWFLKVKGINAYIYKSTFNLFYKTLIYNNILSLDIGW